MKKLLVALALLMPVAFGAALCTVPTSSIPADTGSIAYGDWTATGFSCAVGDKLFSGFLPGAAPTSTSLDIQAFADAGMTIYSVAFGGIFANDFTIEYDIAVTAPNWAITRVSADLFSSAHVGTPSLLKQVWTSTGPNATLLGGTTAYVGAPPPTCTNCFPLILSPGVTTLHIKDIFVAGGGTANFIGNGFVQGVPEPGTLALMGAGLLCVGYFRRRS